MPLPSPHHVSEVGAEGARGLVVLHDTAVVQDLAAVITANQTEEELWTHGHRESWNPRNKMGHQEQLPLRGT